ncbi:MAG: cytochrome c [Longimicrobiales bacterium]|nr:cytochrome c [Longimicrobiales bacterium]
MRRNGRGVPRPGVLLVVATLALGGCTEIEDAMASVDILNFMRESPAFDPYEAPRPAPERSVPVAGPGEKWEPAVENTDAAIRAWGDTLTNPLAMTDDVLATGAETFQTYCAVCHGVGGEGDGPVVGQGKLPFATNLLLETTVDRTDGYLYGVVRLGRGLMPSYRRIPPSERWAVVNYIRHLQDGGAPIPVELPGGVQPGMDPFNTTPADTGQE